MTMTRRTFLGRAVATLAAAAAIGPGNIAKALTESAEARVTRLEAGHTYHFRLWDRPQPFGDQTRWVQLLNEDGQVIAEAGAQPVEFGPAERRNGYARSESRNEIVFNAPTSNWGVVTWAQVCMPDGRSIVDIPLKYPRPVDETENAPAFQAGTLVVEFS